MDRMHTNKLIPFFMMYVVKQKYARSRDSRFGCTELCLLIYIYHDRVTAADVFKTFHNVHLARLTVAIISNNHEFFTQNMVGSF